MEWLKPLVDKLNALSLRERVLIFVACLVLIQQVWDSMLWLNMSQQGENLLGSVEQTEQQINQLQAETLIFSAKLKVDPDTKNRDDIARLEKQLKQVRKDTTEASAQLVSPAEMAKLLEQLIVSEPELELLSMKTLQATPLLPMPEVEGNAAKENPYQVYKHVFSLEFSGSYLATLRYLEALEGLPWTFFWDDIDYTVQKYPNSKVTLLLYTLSLSAGWIGV